MVDNQASDQDIPGPHNAWAGYVPLYEYRQKPPQEHPTAYKVRDILPKAKGRPKTWSAIRTIEPVHDFQNNLNACVGFSTAYIIEQMLLMRGDTTDPTVLLSPLMSWNLAKQIEGDVGQNVGILPHDALTVTRNAGICLRSLLAPTYMPADTSAMPNDAALVDAASRKGISFYQTVAFDDLVQAAGTLDVPVMYTFAVWPSFENPHPDGTMDPFTGMILGYHDIALVEYDESANDDAAWTYTMQNWWQFPSTKDRWVFNRQQALAMGEGWVLQLWPQTVIPKPAPVVAHFVPQGVTAPLWQYIIRGGDTQAALDSGWGRYLRSKGCA